MNQSAKSYISIFIAGFICAGLLFGSLNQPSNNQSRTASANIVAVSQDAHEGIVGEVSVKIVPGDGDVLLETNPFIETDTQVSAKTAKFVAEKVTGTSLENKDVIYSFDIRGKYLGGPSAGASMTIATIAAITGRRVPEDMAFTGTIRRSGRIGKIGSVVKKAKTVGRKDIQKFFVPEGQGSISYYTREIDQNRYYPGIVIEDVNYVRKSLSLNNYTLSNYNMTTEEVSNIQELARNIWKEK